ncbi:hypothetical protein [Litoreibacter ascidiaceicola]|nr:hypothetical protein [Litoreibacter ascidiaceicola]
MANSSPEGAFGQRCIYIPASSNFLPDVKEDAMHQLEGRLASDTAKALINSSVVDGEAFFTFNAQQLR